MNGGHLKISTDELKNVGSNIGSISKEVEDLFTKMDKEVATITSSESWSGKGSQAFQMKFETAKNTIRTDLAQLAALGPAIETVAKIYAQTEEGNVARGS